MVKCFDVSAALSGIIFAYNFYVYLVTGKQFRSDLHKLLCRCSTSSSAPAPAIALAHTHSAPAPAVIAPAAADNDDDDDDVGDDAEVARRVIADTASETFGKCQHGAAPQYLQSYCGSTSTCTGR